MLRLIKKIWHRIRDWVSQWLTPQAPRSNRPLLSALNEAQGIQTLSDTDFEFIFSQLLEGVAHGWHEGRIVKFFDQLGDLGKSRYWVPWLERFGEKVLASPTPNLQLADRLLRLGSMAQAFSQTAPVGEVAYDLGRKLYARESGSAIWEYQGPDEVPLTLADTNGETQQLTLEELLALLEQDENLRQTIAAQMGIVSDQPQEIIDAIVGQAVEQADVEPADSDPATDLPQPPTAIAEEPQPLVTELADKTQQPGLDMIEQWFELGLQQASTGNLQGAIASWDNALALDPTVAEAWHNRATVLGMLGRMEESLNNIDKAIALEPEEASYWFAKAGIYFSLTLWEEAVSAWDQVITLRSDDHQAWHNRGFTLEQQSKIPEAIESYKKALLIQPDFEATQERLQVLLGSADTNGGAVV